MTFSNAHNRQVRRSTSSELLSGLVLLILKKGRGAQRNSIFFSGYITTSCQNKSHKPGLLSSNLVPFLWLLASKLFGEMELVPGSQINIPSSTKLKNKNEAGSHLDFALQSLFIKRKKRIFCPLKSSFSGYVVT